MALLQPIVAFEASDLYTRLENGLLKGGLVLFGDNAYLNSAFMATPYANVSGNPNKKSEDNYNFYHSQLRIRVECVFGMLAARWGILRTAMKYTVTKSIGLVFALARLHNFCLDERGRRRPGEAPMATDPLLDIDREHMLNDDDGYIEMDHSNVHDIAMPTALMDVGHHFDDVPRSYRRTRRKGSEEDLPRTKLHDKVCRMHACRPTSSIRR